MPFVLVVALLVFGFPAAAAAVSCGEALTESVTLDADLACGMGDGLVVFGDDIVIDLAGHTVTGQSEGINNTLGFNRTTVKNGRLSGFEDAILHGGGEGHVIKNVEITNGTSGITLGDGVRFAKIERSTVRGLFGSMITLSGDDNVVSKVVLVNGIGRAVAIFGNRNVVTKSTITGLGDGIVVFSGVSDTVISGNTVCATQGAGIVVATGGGTGTTVTKNRCEGNGSEGLVLQEADDSVVSGNTLIGNGLGMRLANSDRVVVAKNLVTGNRGNGISISADSDAVTVTGNKTHRNYNDGIGTDSTTTLLAKNAADANRQNGIAAANGAQDGGGNKARDNGGLNCAGPGLACK